LDFYWLTLNVGRAMKRASPSDEKPGGPVDRTLCSAVHWESGALCGEGRFRIVPQPPFAAKRCIPELPSEFGPEASTHLECRRCHPRAKEPAGPRWDLQ